MPFVLKTEFQCTVNSPLTDTLVSGQLYLWMPFQIPVLPPKTNSIFTNSRKQTLSRMWMQTLLKMKIGFFFCLHSLISGHSMYNNNIDSW